MSETALLLLLHWLLLFMQTSIVVPMAVVWWRRRRFFSPAIKLLSWYVYLSAFCVVVVVNYEELGLPSNFGFLAGFNIGKMGLFAAVYYTVLKSAKMRKYIAVIATAAVLASVAIFAHSGTMDSVDFIRVTQCAVLACFAMIYLEHSLTKVSTRLLTHDPLWMLSVGQLLYSAGTVTVFSLDYMHTSQLHRLLKFSLVSISGLVFNTFLTLAFLRAKRPEAPTPEPEEAKTAKQLASF